MAITATGTVLTFKPGNTNTGTVSTTITVPADAEIVVVGWAGFFATANSFSTGSMTFTKGGVDTAMTAATGGDSLTTAFQAAMFYQALPDTGANKTLKWDWLGAANSPNIAVCAVAFFKGIDTASPVRSSNGGQALALPYTSGTITALTGDLIVAMTSTFTATGGTTEATFDTWSNLSLLSQIAHNNEADGAMATGSPTGNTTVAALTGTNCQDGGIVAISLKPATAAFQWYPMDFLSFFAELPIIRPILDIIGY